MVTTTASTTTANSQTASFSSTPQKEIPARIQQRFTELKSRVSVLPILTRVGQRFFSEMPNWNEVADKFNWNIVRIWAHLKNVSPERAVIEIAHKTNFLWPDEDQELLAAFESCVATHALLPDDGQQQLAAIGPREVIAAESITEQRPSFRDGKLRLGDNVICTTRLRKGAGSKSEIIFQAFENANWAKEIDNPLLKLTKTAFAKQSNTPMGP
jgi:hypothetical protein